MTPQNATLDSKRTLSRFVSYQRLSSQFQFSLSAVTLRFYLNGAYNVMCTVYCNPLLATKSCMQRYAEYSKEYGRGLYMVGGQSWAK
jgi:hypothetical protein